MQFVGKVITSVSEFYKDINPSTLSGAIDVLVVEDEDGQLSCSPFHVRFGKLQLLRPQEKVVEMRVNGKPVGVRMKVGEAGETFFVLPARGEVPEEYLTSPLVAPIVGGGVEPLTLSPGKAVLSDGEGSPVRRRVSRDAVSDSELEIEGDKNVNEPLSATTDLSVESPPKYSWMWGGLPQKAEDQNAKDQKAEDQNAKDQKAEDQNAKDQNAKDQKADGQSVDDQKAEDQRVGDDKNVCIDGEVDGNADIDTDTSANVSVDADKDFKAEERPISSASIDADGITALDPNLAPRSEATTPMTLTNSVASINLESNAAQKAPAPSPVSQKVDFFEYLNRPAVFKRYYDLFVESGCEKVEFYRSESAVQINVEADSLIEEMTSLMTKIDFSWFIEDPISRMGELSNKTTILLINDLAERVIFLPGNIGFQLVLGRILFKETVPLEVILRQNPLLDPAASLKKDERKSSWRWWSRTPPTVPTAQSSLDPDAVVAGEDTLKKSEPFPSLPFDPLEDEPICYKKSLRLPHEMLKMLDLQNGINSISFTVTTRLQGIATCTARIFRWKSDSRIIVSDIDGTITKSDALGHLFAMVGRDWTHSDIAKLYTAISQNGYNFVYLTSRSLGQVNSTRGYLRAVEQNGKFQLPDGPVITSPDRLLAAFRREVVLGNPQEFKIACLRDLQQLFPSNPFYAGFGNRTNDASAYISIGIPPPRIFIVNPSGTVAVEPLTDQYAGSYSQLIDLVDQIFPSRVTKEETFNDFWYWRRPLSMANLLGELLPEAESPTQIVTVEDEEEEEEEEGLVPAYYV